VYTVDGYEARAQECVRLANLTTDRMVQADLLKLRQTYLLVASRLSQLTKPGLAERGASPSGDSSDT
jgi:hypothetical protein